MWQTGLVGSVQKTATGSVPISGVTAATAKEIRLYSFTVLSGGTAGVLKLYNGTSVGGGTLWLQFTCPTVSTGNFLDLGVNGLLFPNGCFAVLDSNCTSVTFAFYGDSDVGVSSSCSSSSLSSSSSSCRSSSSSCRSSSSSSMSLSSSSSSCRSSSSSSSCRSSSSSSSSVNP